MNEWKELDVNNLPPDILTGEYEFQRYCPIVHMWEPSLLGGDVLEILGQLGRSARYRYRRIQKPEPTHQEIITKWWKHHIKNEWRRVITYKLEPECGHYQYRFLPNGAWFEAEYFTSLESDDIQPGVEGDRA